MLLRVLVHLDDDAEITAVPGRELVRLRSVDRLCALGRGTTRCSTSAATRPMLVSMLQAGSSLRFVIRSPRSYEPEAWKTSVAVTPDAGKDMQRLAAEFSALFS